MQAKIALLTKLAFGATVSSDSVRREACDEIQSADRAFRGGRKMFCFL